MADFNIAFEDNKILEQVQFSESAGGSAAFGEVQIMHTGGEIYTGAYDITPRVDKQVIPTQGKVMARDMTVKSIPFFKTSNDSGGNTVYIAKEL